MFAKWITDPLNWNSTNPWLESGNPIPKSQEGEQFQVTEVTNKANQINIQRMWYNNKADARKLISPSNVSDQEKIYHKLFVNSHDLCFPSSMQKKPEDRNS